MLPTERRKPRKSSSSVSIGEQARERDNDDMSKRRRQIHRSTSSKVLHEKQSHASARPLRDDKCRYLGSMACGIGALDIIYGDNTDPGLTLSHERKFSGGTRQVNPCEQSLRNSQKYVDRIRLLTCLPAQAPTHALLSSPYEKTVTL